MFFEKDTMSFHILDVLWIDQENISMSNSERNFCALSFRYRADTVIQTEKEEYRMRDNFVSYFPARLNYNRISKRDDMIVVHFETTSYHAKKIEYFECKDSERLPKLFREIWERWNRKEVGYKLQCSAIFYEILAECYVQNYRQDENKSKIQPSIDYIHRNYKNSDLTVKEVAEQSFMSEVYFRKLFRAELGSSPQKYIINMRIQHAAGLISMGYYSLKEIAYMSGYSDYKYFSVEFKKAMGISPSEYLYNYQGKV